MLGQNIGQEFLDSPALREQVLQSLIDAEATVQGAVKAGLRVGDAQVARTIRSMPAFQDSGQFATERYKSALRSQGLSSQGFELDLRRSLLSEQLRAAFRRTAIVTNAEVDRALRIRNEQRVVKLLSVAPAAVISTAPDEATITAWYEGHMDQYMQPEQVSIRYLELSRDDIAKKITVVDEELRAIYEQRKQLGSFGLPEQREARHILIEVPAQATSEEVDAARVEIDAVRKRIVGGEDFAAVATEVSQDAGSAPLGGQLGQFGRGVMDPAFEDVAFSLSVNDISEPVRSGFGWHLIEVNVIHAAKVRSFEESREDVLHEYQSAQADEIFAEQAERLATLGFENPESLEVAAQALGLTIKSSAFFNLRGARAEGVTANPRVRAAAFSADVLEAGNNSELLEIDGERRVMVRVAERKIQRQKDLDEVRDEIAGSLKFEDSVKRASAVGKRVLDGLRNGVSLTTLAQDMSAELVAGSAQEPTLKWGNARTLTRDAPAGVPGSIAKIVFRMATPASGSVRYEGSALPSGGYAVIELTEVSQAPSELSEEALKAQRARLLGELQGGRGGQAFSAMQKSLRRHATVVIKQQNLRPDEG